MTTTLLQWSRHHGTNQASYAEGDWRGYAADRARDQQCMGGHAAEHAGADIPVYAQASALAADMAAKPAYTATTIDTTFGSTESHIFAAGSDDYTFQVIYNGFPVVTPNARQVLNGMRDGEATCSSPCKRQAGGRLTVPPARLW